MVTPPDDTCIMNGVTRKTILDMKDWIERTFDLKVVERQISIQEMINSSKEGRLFEAFGGATHTHLLPFNRIVYKDTTMFLEQGEVCKRLCAEINDVMRSNAVNNNWITPME